jgi:hypothetical protein
MKVGGGDWSKDGKDTGTLKKRMAGYKMAGRKVNPGLAASMGKAPRVAANEEAEQVDEGLGGAYRYNQMMKRKRNEYLGMVKKHQDAGHDLQTAKNKASQELDALEAKRRKNARPLPQTRDLMKLSTDELKRLQKKEEFEQVIEDLSPRLQETMYNIHDRLNEENRDKFVAACQTEEGLEKMIAFAIENRGE